MKFYGQKRFITGATTVDGKMIDEVHFKQAKALLELVKQ